MIYYDILDDRRRALLPGFAFLKNKEFYLAGGTGLTLQIGHRDSVDFDFFRKEPFNTERLLEEVKQAFIGHALLTTQEAENTLSIVIDDAVLVSLFSYPYPLIGQLIDTECFSIASLEDIGCMKLSAIAGRATLKDYVDIYYILKVISLNELLKKIKIKMPTLDTPLLLKSLVYFDDLHDEPLMFKHGHEIDLETIKKNLTEQVATYTKRELGFQN